MARLVQFDYATQNGSFARLERASNFTSATAVGALLFVVAGTGALLLRAAATLREAFAAWAEARRQREEDRKLWDLALEDSRVMADLIALSQDRSAEARRIVAR